MESEKPYYVIASPANQNQLEGVEVNQPPAPAPLTMKAKIWTQVVGVPGVICGALIGAGLGIALQKGGASSELISWIALPGDLFIRALKCLVAPLVFCSLVTGMSDMLAVGKATSIGWRTAVAYTFTTVVAATQGLIWVLIFRPMFNSKPKTDDSKPIHFAFACDGEKSYLTHASNGSVVCSSNNIKMENGTFNSHAVFTADDINGIFKKTTAGYKKLSLSESLQLQLKEMVPSNITDAFARSALLSIVMFAIPFGIALAMLPKTKQVVIGFFREMNMILMSMIRGIIVLTTFAVVFLLAGSLAVQDDLSGLVRDVGTLILCVSVGLIVHCFGFLPTFLFVMTKINPLAYYKHIIPAQVFALGCASSMATLPVTMKCVDATKQVSTTLSRFVLSLGATINMDGSALYYPAGIVFMAEVAGHGHLVGGVEMFLIIIVSTIGAVGSAPVPAAGLVMIITIWNSVFPTVTLPPSFSYIVATDWLLDRFITATNVTGDTVIARVIANMVGEDSFEEERQSLASITSHDYLADKAQLRHELEVDRQSRSDVL